MVAGENETFCMVNVAKGQCSLTVQDTENGYLPEVDLEPIEVNYGHNFVGDKYLSSWTFQNSNPAVHILNDRSTFADIQVFKGSEGRRIYTVSAELTYHDLPDGTEVAKNSQFFLLLNEKDQPADFKERLSYVVHKSNSFETVNVPGKSRYDSELKSTAQNIEVDNSVVSFQRTTANGVKITASCKLD